MPSRRPWFRFYTSFRTDPRLRGLPAETILAFVDLLCLAAESSRQGHIELKAGVPFPDKMLAGAIHISPRSLAKVLETLTNLDIGGLKKLEDGTLFMEKWRDNQPLDPTSAARKQHSRQLRLLAEETGTSPGHERDDVPDVTGESREEENRIEKSREEENRIEKSTEEEGTPLPSSPHPPQDSNHLYPEWFYPITRLAGFKAGPHERAIGVIRVACEVAGVEPGLVVRDFAEYYPIGQADYGWKDPVQSLRKTAVLQAKKAKESARHGGATSPKFGDMRDRA